MCGGNPEDKHTHSVDCQVEQNNTLSESELTEDWSIKPQIVGYIHTAQWNGYGHQRWRISLSICGNVLSKASQTQACHCHKSWKVKPKCLNCPLVAGHSIGHKPSEA